MNLDHWTSLFHNFLSTQEGSDPAHDLPHTQRVVLNTQQLAQAENLSLEVLLPAAWLHDCLHIPKDSPLRSKASQLSADHAIAFLKKHQYPTQHHKAIHHAIAAHSFTAQIPPRSIEAKILQDADRIDALGAIGLSRCLMLGGHMGSALMSPIDPFCESRPPDDAKFCVDHFFSKLLKLENSMQTEAGRALAKERSDFLRLFLKQLQKESFLSPAPV